MGGRVNLTDGGGNVTGASKLGIEERRGVIYESLYLYCSHGHSICIGDSWQYPLCIFNPFGGTEEGIHRALICVFPRGRGHHSSHQQPEGDSLHSEGSGNWREAGLVGGGLPCGPVLGT